jgi:YD repeat-containing protein
MRLMRGSVLTLIACLSVAFPAPAASRAVVLRAWDQASLAFEPNRGQFAADVQFAARARGYAVAVGASGLRVRSLAPAADGPGPDALNRLLKPLGLDEPAWARRPRGAAHELTLGLRGSKPWRAVGEDRQAAQVHYLRAGGSLSHLPQFARVRVPAALPGVDILIYGNGTRLEYDLVLAPGADSTRIEFEIGGASHIRLSPEGDLLLETPAGGLRQKKPLVLQEGRPVEAAFRILAANRVGFRLGAYDRSKPLVIDPVLFSTYIGGTEDERAYGIAADPAGNLYITGTTSSTNFPSSAAFDASYNGGTSDGFIVKLNAAGTQRVYSTYIGGNAADQPVRIQADAQGNAYVVGNTRSRDFPTTAGAPQRELRGGQDAFALKLSADGARLLYSTFAGGTNDEAATAILVDPQGALLLAGTTNSTDLPATDDAHARTPRGGFDGWFAVLNAAGTQFAHLSYLGATGNDTVNGAALGSGGNLYFTGQTDSPNFPTTANAYRASISGGVDAYLLRLSADFSRIEYCTLLGGRNLDSGTDVIVDRSETVLLGGITASPDFPVVSGKPSPYRGGATDIFLTQFAFSRGARAGGQLLPASTEGLAHILAPLPRGPFPYPVSPVNNPPQNPPGPPSLEPVPVLYSVLLGSDGEDGLFRMDSSGSEIRLAARFSGTQFVTPVAGISTCSGGQNNFGLITFRFGQEVHNPLQQCFGPGTGTDAAIVNQTVIFAGFVGGPVLDAIGGGQGYVGKEDAVVFAYTPLDSNPLIREAFNLTAGERGFNHGVAGDPVSAASGELYESELDLSPGGPMNLRFERYYATLLRTSGVSSSLGPNWMHNFDSRLQVRDNRASVRLYRGRKIDFQRIGNEWLAVNAEQYNYQLIAETTSYRFYDPVRSEILTFNPTGLMVRIEDLRGNALTLTQSPQGPEEVSDGLGRTLRFTYDAGRLVRVADVAGRAFTYQYTGDTLTSVTAPDGGVTAYTYTTAGPRVALLAIRTEPEGNAPFSQEYDSAGRVARQRDGRGNATVFAYDTPEPGVTRVTDPLLNQSFYRHEGQNNLIEHTDAEGRRTRYAYNAFNLLRTVQDPAGGIAIDTYDSAGNLIRRTDAAGLVTSHTYGEFRSGPIVHYRRTSTQHPDGSSELFRYDANGNLTSYLNRAGQSVTFTYDARGWLTSVRRPTGAQIEYTYNPDGTLLQIREESGDVTRFEYDTLLRRSRMVWPDGTIRSFSYDSRDRLIGVTDERGRRHTLEYDRNGRLISWIDTAGQRRLYSYDSGNRLAVHTEPGGRAWRFAYDALGRLETRTDPSGAVLRYRYDRAGRVIEISDAVGRLFAITYDANGRAASVTDGAGLTARYGRDALGRITEITEPGGRVLRFDYDAAGRIAAVRNPLGEITRFTYRRGGLPQAETLPGSEAVSFEYNNDSLLTRVSDAAGGVWNFERNASGLVAAATDPLGRRTQFTWGNRRRLIGVRQPDGTTATLAYDPAGQFNRIAYSDGTEIEIQRDERGLPLRGTGFFFSYDAAARMSGSNGIQIGRDEAGRLVSLAYTPERVVRYAYDARGLLSRVTDWAGGSMDFLYDAAPRLIRIVRSNRVITEFTYGADARLSRITHSGGANVNFSIALERDAAGRIVTASRSPAVSFALNPSTQEMPSDNARQWTGGRYDELGRLISDGRRTFRWDAASRLREAVSGAVSFRFDYDAFGQMTLAQRTLVWNYATAIPTLAIERTGSDDQVYHVYTPSGQWLYSIDPAGERRFGHFDEAGNTLAVTSNAGSAIETYAITPYGESVTRTGTTQNPFTFRGSEGVLDFSGAGAGRFLTRDPVFQTAAAQANPYQFARANPIAYSDPTGLTPRPGWQPDPPAAPVPAAADPAAAYAAWAEYLPSLVNAAVPVRAHGIPPAVPFPLPPPRPGFTFDAPVFDGGGLPPLPWTPQPSRGTSPGGPNWPEQSVFDVIAEFMNIG